MCAGASEPGARNPWGCKFMSSISRIIAASLLVACAAAGTASAQNFSATPTYGTVTLASGFPDDPKVVAVQSGGTVDSAALNSQPHAGTCAGNIATPPDVRLMYTSGQLPLIISVDSQSDTTLVINGPDGHWSCDDDSGQGPLNPSVRYEHPASGQYDIWIGTYGGTDLHPAQLNISELTSK